MLRIGPKVPAERSSEGRQHFGHEQVPRRFDQDRIGDGVGNEVVAGEKSPVGERRVRGVEDSQLGLLVQGDVGDELDARSLPGRSTGWELVFQNPLREWFGDDRPGVDDAVAAQLVAVSGMCWRLPFTVAPASS